MDALYALASEAQAARDRGRRARDRLVVEGQDDRQLRRHLRVELPSQQEHHDDRRRRAGGQRRARGARPSRCCASTASAACPTARATSGDAGGKFNLPDVNAAVGLRQLAQLHGVQRQAARARRALLRALSHRSAVRAAASRLPAATRPATAGTCSRRCCRCPTLASHAPGLSRSDGGARHRHRRLVRGGAPCDSVPALRLSSRRPAAHRAHRRHDRDPAAVPDDDGRRRRPRVRRVRGDPGRASQVR